MENNTLNSGYLFKKENKEDEKQPDLTGTINVNGKEYWISGWKNVSKVGTSYLKLAVREKEEQTRQVSQPTRKSKPEFDDPLDF